MDRHIFNTHRQYHHHNHAHHAHHAQPPPPPPPPGRLNQVALHCGELFTSLRGWLPWQLSSLEPPRGGGGDVCARGFDTSVRRSRWSWPRPVITPPELSRRRSRRGGWQAKTCTKPYGDRGRPGQSVSGQESYRILADVVDSSSLRFLAASALAARRKEEEERRMQENSIL